MRPHFLTAFQNFKNSGDILHETLGEFLSVFFSTEPVKPKHILPNPKKYKQTKSIALSQHETDSMYTANICSCVCLVLKIWHHSVKFIYLWADNQTDSCTLRAYQGYVLKNSGHFDLTACATVSDILYFSFRASPNFLAFDWVVVVVFICSGGEQEI